MANCFMEDFEFQNVTVKPTGAQISAVQGASRAIGQVLAESLRTRTSEYTPMLLQIAFQAYLVSTLGQAWVLGPSRNRFITSIYQSLRRVEAQFDSGRWRSLARHSNHSYPESLVEGIIVGFSDILLAAGCTAPQSDIISRIVSKLKRRIALLVELSGRLNKTVGEVGSNDLEILVVLPGEKFESKYMEYADGEQAAVQDATVLCTTRFGLMKRIPVGTLWEKGKKQKMVVLKVEVLLQSFLNTEG
ncbi:hypothetical protein EV363DRAFT_1183239 [Boletus edulis]|nr:hypothetical protein EV363DRAFT_1183072 [Boletus edulis]KAF8122248.1 hypothetical protein EV363DRAFT_1183239 [Boletus edulis]